MKKKLFPLVVTSLLSLTACGSKQYQPSDYKVKSLKYHDGFKILQLTDIHLSDKDDAQRHFDFMNLTVNDEKAKDADLIVVTGDLFTFASRTTAKRLFNYLDGIGKPWTVVFGNHDEQCYFPVTWMTDYLNNFGSNCRFLDLQDDNVFGNCNFTMDLVDDSNNTKFQLIFMDSNRYDFSSSFGYDHIKKDQVEWYEEVVKANGGVKSFMFSHIPLPEINPAWENCADKETPDKVVNGSVVGEKREKTCPPDTDPAVEDLFEKIVELGSTKGMFFGHDHVNTFNVTYQGVLFSYGIKSTDRIYFDEDLLGGQVITIDDVNNFHVEHIFHTYEEVK